MTNPDNIVRVRARNGGRASVYEANGWAQAFSSGLFEGNGVTQNTSADMHVLVGGSSSKPDVILAENPSGYKIALDIVGQQAITLTAPASNSRISAIVAYTDDLSLSTDQTTVTGSPASCGLIVVNGSASSNPSAPTDTQIRNAITADGATGSQASYAVIATVRVAYDTTIITDTLITTNRATLNVANNVTDASITANKIDFVTSVDSNGWTVMTLSNNVVLFLKKGNYQKTMEGNSWGYTVASPKPASLSTSHSFFGGAGGSSSDRAINVSGDIGSNDAEVIIQNQNIFASSVSANISWWAYIIEFLS